MSMSAIIELYSIFSEVWGKEKAQEIIKAIDALIDDYMQKSATKEDILKGIADLMAPLCRGQKGKSS